MNQQQNFENPDEMNQQQNVENTYQMNRHQNVENAVFPNQRVLNIVPAELPISAKLKRSRATTSVAKRKSFC